MTKKMTKKDYFNELKNIPAVAENEALMNFIDHEIDLLNRKNTSSTGEKKMTATQKASSVLKRLVDKGEVVKTVEKKVSYFSIA